MNSPSHKENVLGANYRDIGVAVVNGELAGSETTLVVQMFGITRSAQQALVQKPAEVEVFAQAAAVEINPPEEVTPPTVASLAPSSEPQPEVIPAFSSGPSARGITKTASLVFLVFLHAFFIVDCLYIYKKGIVRVSGNTLAHISLLLFLMMVVWWVEGGLIL